MKKISLFVLSILLISCTENYSVGERIGVITQFSRSGVFFKSWEGHLNVTQTGMNSSVPFDFSIDNNDEPPEVIKTIDSAAQYGWKVKLVYHEVWGKNITGSRGETNHFVEKVEVLDRNMATLFNSRKDSTIKGHVIDTIYVVIDKSK